MGARPLEQRRNGLPWSRGRPDGAEISSSRKEEETSAHEEHTAQEEDDVPPRQGYTKADSPRGITCARVQSSR
jgi:hypothetical protein